LLWEDAACCLPHLLRVSGCADDKSGASIGVRQSVGVRLRACSVAVSSPGASGHVHRYQHCARLRYLAVSAGSRRDGDRKERQMQGCAIIGRGSFGWIAALVFVVAIALAVAPLLAQQGGGGGWGQCSDTMGLMLFWNCPPNYECCHELITIGGEPAYAGGCRNPQTGICVWQVFALL